VKRPSIDLYYQQFPQRQTFDEISTHAALDASKSALEAMGYEIQAVNADVGIVRTKVRPAVIPEVCDCGTWNLDPVRGTADSTLVINVEKSGDGKS